MTKEEILKLKNGTFITLVLKIKSGEKIHKVIVVDDEFKKRILSMNGEYIYSEQFAFKDDNIRISTPEDIEEGRNIILEKIRKAKEELAVYNANYEEYKEENKYE